MAKIVVDLVAEGLDGSRLDNRSRIGVDEIPYRKGFHYLTARASR